MARLTFLIMFRRSSRSALSDLDRIKLGENVISDKRQRFSQGTAVVPTLRIDHMLDRHLDTQRRGSYCHTPLFTSVRR
jgi:hypothetical protein